MNKTRRCMYKFWDLSDYALRYGLLTPDQINRVWDRRRKRGHWCRHLVALKAMIELARERRIAEHQYVW